MSLLYTICFSTWVMCAFTGSSKWDMDFAIIWDIQYRTGYENVLKIYLSHHYGGSSVFVPPDMETLAAPKQDTNGRPSWLMKNICRFAWIIAYFHDYLWAICLQHKIRRYYPHVQLQWMGMMTSGDHRLVCFPCFPLQALRRKRQIKPSIDAPISRLRNEA